MTRYVTTADALFFHKMLIERCGGSPGVRDFGALESALRRPQSGYYESVIHEAAALFESVVQNHPFVDGNKRVAFAVVDVFLRINGLRLPAHTSAIYGMMMSLFEKQSFNMTQLVPWLQANVVAEASSG